MLFPLVSCIRIQISNGSFSQAIKVDRWAPEATSPKEMFLNVREFFEYRGRRIKDAVNIPSSGNLEFTADTIDKNCALFLYCTTDYRSIRVARYFYDQGFSKIYSLEGGIVAWRREGMPVEKKRVRRKR